MATIAVRACLNYKYESRVTQPTDWRRHLVVRPRPSREPSIVVLPPFLTLPRAPRRAPLRNRGLAASNAMRGAASWSGPRSTKATRRRVARRRTARISARDRARIAREVGYVEAGEAAPAEDRELGELRSRSGPRSPSARMPRRRRRTRDPDATRARPRSRRHSPPTRPATDNGERGEARAPGGGTA